MEELSEALDGTAEGCSTWPMTTTGTTTTRTTRRRPRPAGQRTRQRPRLVVQLQRRCGQVTAASIGMLLFLILIVAVVAGDSTTPRADEMPSEDDWLSGCLLKGYDPYQLACSTCLLLPTSAQDDCHHCCQAYKDVERIRKPYESAVLVMHHKGAGGEIQQFLDDDWDKLVASKGASRLSQLSDPNLHHLSALRAREGGGAGAGGMFYFHVPIAHLLFFDSTDVLKSGGSGDNDSHSAPLLDQAKEVIRLDGWKRDDIRDMIAALLP